MSKISIDYSELENKIYKKAYKLSEVKDKIEVVAFDVVRFKDNDSRANLWQIQSSKDGDYIVAIYDNEESDNNKKWEVVVNKISSDLQFYYNGEPIVRVSSSKLGIPKSELNSVSNYLPTKLAENTKLVKSLLKELDESHRKSVLNKYPELA